MRMPILSYFAVIGAGLLAALVWFGNTIEPSGAPIATTQMVGLPQPYKTPPTPPPEATPALALAMAPMPVARPEKVIASHQKTAKKVVMPVRKRFAEYPYRYLNIP
jgi:hypothetical protein